jgi:hypothetical protein
MTYPLDPAGTSGGRGRHVKFCMNSMGQTCSEHRFDRPAARRLGAAAAGPAPGPGAAAAAAVCQRDWPGRTVTVCRPRPGQTESL